MKKLFILSVAILTTFAVSLNAQTVQRKCGTMEYLALQKAADPTLELRIQNYEQALHKWIENNQDYINSSKSTITVPVVVHIVYNSSTENISDTRVYEQISILNTDYGGLNTHSMQAFDNGLKANTELQFCLAQRTPSGQPTTGIERRQTTLTSFTYVDNAVKYYSKGGLDAWDPTKYINIWVCNLSGGICGYGQFPVGGLTATYGVVINYRYFGKTGAIAPYNLGGTTSHEIGHCFNLYHIWGDDNGLCTGTDYCNDVPNQANYTYGVHTGVLTDACMTASPGIMYMNFMDYSDDISYANFTPDQKARIAALFVPGGLLYSLTLSDGCTAVEGAICDAPAGLTTTSVAATTASLSWNAVTNAVSYNIQYRKSGTTTFSATTSSVNAVTLTGLTSGTTYEYQVQAVCAFTGSYSGLSTFTTPTVCTDVYESNNTAKLAKPISVNTAINAMISTSTDVDYFKFSNSKTKKNIQIILSNLPGDYDVALYKSDGKTLLRKSENTGTASETITYNNAAAATYIIKVYGKSGAYSATSCYTLTASISGTIFRFESGNAGQESVISEDLLLYPNPASNTVTVSFNSVASEDVEISIYDLTGRMVNTGIFKAAEGVNASVINVSNLSKGIYIVALKNADDLLTKKLIIDK